MLEAAEIMALTRGWQGLGLAYTAVQVPMLAGLLRGRAQLHKLLLSPLLALPLTTAAGLGISAAHAVMHEFGFAADGLLQLAVSAGVTVWASYAGGLAVARRASSESMHLRGALVVPPMATRQRGRADTVESRGRDRKALGQTITIAGIPISRQDETKHFKFIGTTGAGKSTAIHELLGSALRRGDRAVIADPDGGYLRHFYDRQRGDVILNPFDTRSMQWDLFGEIRTAYDVDHIARSLIPEQGASDRSWREYARTFFVAVTRQAHAAGVRDVAELYRLLVAADTTELRILVKGTPAQPFLDEHNGRMFDSIRSVTSSAVGALDYISQQKGPKLSIRDWVARQVGEPAGGVLFIPYRASEIAALRPSVSAWMRLAMFEAMDQREGDQRLWFIVDELDALGQIEGLKDALARLRKFGGRCVLGFQSIGQVSSTYGIGEAQTIVENCGNSLILRCSASEHGGTAQFASRLIGQREVLRSTVSRSQRITEFLPSITRSEHFNFEPAVMDSEIEQLPDFGGYLKTASAPEWIRVKLVPAIQQEGPLRPDGRCSAAPEAGASTQLRREALGIWTFWRRGRQAEEQCKRGAVVDPKASNGYPTPGR